ncbi:uncharacterized protein LOC111362598 isoform X2 [Spodoptera litura]|uniref:Uncharacterized protein LOC111362598 isoform X2 n=1 Tax=Spodoptera litura TaxID=69820 RepID=A0A9J7EP87_SPOLT|nr:uncharacterized protein LOC111362598 isoform X2 [Spodoptera litura]
MCRRVAPVLLAHVNLLLTLYGGAALATAARLKWDPSTYLALRELFPAEYRAACAVLTAGGAALLALPHVAAAAAHIARARRALLLYVYAALMTMLVLGEVAFCAWLALQVLAWQQSEAARQLAEALELSDHLRPLLDYMARWHPLPHRVDQLIQEASEDAPRNAYVALVLGVLLPVLQVLGAAAALLAARAPRSPRASASDAELSLQPRPPSYNSASGYGYQKMPRTAYRNGRIVVLG